MKFKIRIAAALVAAIMLALPFELNAQRPDDVEFVTESLSNYMLGYMSWGIKKMGLDKLQEKLEAMSGTLPEVRVAVIDSGLNTSNKYLEGRYVDGYNFLKNNTDYNDDQYHGTMVSGIIVDGTSSNVKILPIKVNDESGRGSMQNVSKGIYYAIEHGADVINLSLSSEDKNRSITILDDAIEAAVQKGIVVVVASGNQSGDTAYRYPANKENVLTITSVDKRNKIGENANTGADVDFALPGVNVWAPYKTIAMVQTGTSLAAPHASAAAALLKTWNKSLDQNGVKEILKQYSVDLGAKGFDNTYGWGMIDLSGFDPKVKPTEPATEPATEPVTEPVTEPATEPTTAPEEPFILGDVNCDGIIDVTDATCVQRYCAGISNTVFDLRAADADGDGSVTVVDATVIQRYAAGLITSLPPEQQQ